MIDITEIYEYEKLLEELPSVTTVNAGIYLRDTLKAYNKCVNFHKIAVENLNKTTAKRKGAKAVAALERVHDYVANNENLNKVTDKIREEYAHMDQDYQAACDEEAEWQALEKYLSNKILAFRMAHDDVKKIAGFDAEV